MWPCRALHIYVQASPNHSKHTDLTHTQTGRKQQSHMHSIVTCTCATPQMVQLVREPHNRVDQKCEHSYSCVAKVNALSFLAPTHLACVWSDGFMSDYSFMSIHLAKHAPIPHEACYCRPICCSVPSMLPTRVVRRLA